MKEKIKKIFESYKIKKIIKTYKLLSKENPNLSEDELCRRIIADRLYITRWTNGIGIKSIEDVDYFVNKVFEKGEKLIIEEACAWIMLREHEGGLLPPLREIGNKNYMTKIETKTKRREEFLNKAQEILRSIEVKPQ